MVLIHWDSDSEAPGHPFYNFILRDSSFGIPWDRNRIKILVPAEWDCNSRVLWNRKHGRGDVHIFYSSTHEKLHLGAFRDTQLKLLNYYNISIQALGIRIIGLLGQKKLIILGHLGHWLYSWGSHCGDQFSVYGSFGQGMDPWGVRNNFGEGGKYLKDLRKRRRRDMWYESKESCPECLPAPCLLNETWGVRAICIFSLNCQK